MKSPRWTAVSQSSFAWEREALEFLREHLPDYDPWRAWSNIEFIDDEGRVNEVDCLVLTSAGLILIEIKSRPGTVQGDPHSWIWTTDGRRYDDDNPLPLANRKAKRLASILRRQDAFSRSHARSPWVEAVIFLSAVRGEPRIDSGSAHKVFLRGAPRSDTDRGIIAALTGSSNAGLGRPGTVDAASARATQRAIEQAGIRPAARSRRVGDYELGAPLAEGEGWQDFLAKHISLPDIVRRIRVYPFTRAASQEERSRLGRMAAREFRVLEGIEHPGILRVLHFQDTELGPALVFEHDAASVRLDQFLGQRLSSLDVNARLDLLRQLAVALGYAQGKRLYHQSLAPQNIMVRDIGGARPRLQIMNWQVAVRGEGSNTAFPMTSGTRNLDDHFNDPVKVYIAPEALGAGTEVGARADVFSLGAIAYHLFTGKPPAESPIEIPAKLAAGGGLRLSAAIDGIGSGLEDLVRMSTAPDVAQRIGSATEFLEYMALAEADDRPPAQTLVTVDPSVAQSDDRLDGGLIVIRRLGRGSTADAVLVRREDNETKLVLKVAIDEAHGDRVRAEAEVLAPLGHPNIVRYVNTVTVSGRVGMLMEWAGEESLATIIRGPNGLSLDLVRRYGDELLQAADYLEQQGDLLNYAKPQVRGEDCRDWMLSADEGILFPFDADFVQWASVPTTPTFAWFWSLRTTLWNRTTFGGGTYRTRGRPWYDYHQFPIARARTPLTITFAFVQTHNHFVFDRGGKVFNRSAPVIKLPAGASEDDHLGILGLLNSSTACFWIKQVCHNKGGQGVNEGVKAEAWERFLEVTGTRLEPFPLAANPPLDLARALDTEAQRLAANLPDAVCARTVPSRDSLDIARVAVAAGRARMIALQEDLDWRCYRLYGLVGNAPEHADPPPLLFGERAFEILMARRIAQGTLETTWFSRHGSTPVADLPAHWPADYRAVVERRIALIETDPAIGLIERPECKRRWSMDTWEEIEREALRTWLLNRLEDHQFWPDPAELMTTNQLADRVRRDAAFMSVGVLYRGHEDFDHEVLVAELVGQASVPFLAALRYTETGQRKRVQWEGTWRLQRREDAIDAEVAAASPTFLARAEAEVEERWRAINLPRDTETPDAYAHRMMAAITGAQIEAEVDLMLAAEQRRRKNDEVGDIPVPPKYISKDFRSPDYWRLRGGLDVPKERFVSFPYCSPEADGSLLVTWAGHNHLARAMAIGTFYQARKDEDGWPAERLVPLLAGLQELLSWLLQWHNEVDEGGMGDYFREFIRDEARAVGLTEDAVAAWTPPTRTARGRRRASA
jgi:serine/threonine protein kinase